MSELHHLSSIIPPCYGKTCLYGALFVWVILHDLDLRNDQFHDGGVRPARAHIHAQGEDQGLHIRKV